MRRLDKKLKREGLKVWSLNVVRREINYGFRGNYIQHLTVYCYVP
jgi:hypothetical protein